MNAQAAILRIGIASTVAFMPTSRVDCPFCDHLGTVTGERVIRAQTATLTTYFCDACHTEWDEREGDTGPSALRKRPPMTTGEKQSAS